MKTINQIMLALLMVAGVTFAQAQENEKEEDENQIEVPDVISNIFKKDFPEISDVRWEAEDGDYEASFKKDGADMSVLYDKTGHRKETETAIKTDQLPQSSRDYIKQYYSSFRIIEAAKIVSDKGVVTYEAEIGKDGRFRDVLFDVQGKFIREEEGD